MLLREENCEGCKKSIHFNGSNENIELLLRTVTLLSVYGAVADYCNELSEGVGAPGNLMHLIIGKRWKFLPTFLLQKLIQTVC